MLHTLQQIAWPSRTFYALLLIAAVANFVAAVGPDIKGTWRFHYIYTAVVTSLYFFYVVLRVTNVLDIRDFAFAVRWLIPCMVFPFIMPVAIIRWEKYFIRKAVERRVSESCS